jgi:hypothetical protein
MSSKSSEGEIGGLSDSVKFKGPLLWESLPEANGDTSYNIKNNFIVKSWTLNNVRGT